MYRPLIDYCNFTGYADTIHFTSRNIIIFKRAFNGIENILNAYKTEKGGLILYPYRTQT